MCWIAGVEIVLEIKNTLVGNEVRLIIWIGQSLIPVRDFYKILTVAWNEVVWFPMFKLTFTLGARERFEGHLEFFFYFHQWISAKYIVWVVWYSYDIILVVAFWVDMPVNDNKKKYENW